jgi:hypothetical protein
MNEELPKLIDDAKAVAEDAQKTFGPLSAEQLNWKPNAESWSVAQCFEHLIVTNSGYFPIIKKLVSGEYKHSLKERFPLLPKLFGKIVINAVKPEAPRKVKAATKFQPSNSALDAGIINKFVGHQQEIIEHIKMTENLNLSKIIITSPIINLITYSLLDAYKIIVAHEQRHLSQAKRVMQTEGFPKL